MTPVARRTVRLAGHLSTTVSSTASVSSKAGACSSTVASGTPPSVLVVGASRGIGLGLVKAYAQAGWEVHATTRTPGHPGELGELHGNVKLHACDVTALGAGESLVASLGNTPLDVVIYNAGINPKSETGVAKSKVVYTNAIAPFLVVAPILKNGNLQGGAQKKLAFVSSQLGSREEFGEELGLASGKIYHSSKCVLNDGFREQEPAWRASYGLTSVVFHPGWVVTDMGGEHADITVEESAKGIKTVLEDISLDDTGKFLTWNGTEHPW